MQASTLTAIFMAVISGVAIGFQGTFNSLLSKTVGLWESTFIVHLTGLAAVTAIMLLFGQGNLFATFQAPRASLLGGLLGVVVVAAVILAFRRLGAMYALGLVIFSQLLVAAVVDHFGWFGIERAPFSLARAFGLLLLGAGVYFFKR
ncbi:MAG: DMT family transporter [Syntrophothermus sp.]